MRVELRDDRRRRIGRVAIDPAQRPTRVTVQTPHRAARSTSTGAAEAVGVREVFLNWDSALDDAGQLRRCVACGCPELFREKAFPQVTAIVVMLAFVGGIIGALGLAENLPFLIAMAVVLVLDVAILVFSRRRLVCYRCRSTYHHLPIARYHRGWDRSRAERFPPEPIESNRNEEISPTPVQPSAAVKA
jgi:hypothetical protein